MATVQLPNLDCPVNDDVQWAIVPEDASGVPVPDTLTFASSDTAVFVAQPAADGLSCRFLRQAGAAVGAQATLTVSDPSGNQDSVLVTLIAIPPGPPAQFVSTIGVVPSAS